MREGKRVTAKLKVQSVNAFGSDQVQVTFSPDYQNDRNKDWAVATPALSLSMTMRADVANQFEQGEAIDMILSRNPDQGERHGQVPEQASQPDAEQA
jgi:hypothetical protein